MSSPKNIQRDCKFAQPLTSGILDWATEDAISLATCAMNSSGSVNVDFASAQSDHTVVRGVGAGNKRVLGVLMQEPENDRVPYRIKASALNMYEDSKFAIVIGYAPASPTGINDSIDEPVYIPFDREFDETVIVEALDSGDGNFGRALAVGVCYLGDATGYTNDPVLVHLSVQNLSVKPPTMAQAVA